MTGGRAETDAAQRAKSAVVVALAPVCVERFQKTTDAADNLVELKKVDSWSQGAFVEKGGWASMPGTNAPEQTTAVATA
ncbi:MAG: hypothetical protein ABI920_14475 [Casimicrobiaceae bacterium]